jgi:hypothetical protein
MACTRVKKSGSKTSQYLLLTSLKLFLANVLLMDTANDFEGDLREFAPPPAVDTRDFDSLKHVFKRD